MTNVSSFVLVTYMSQKTFGRFRTDTRRIFCRSSTMRALFLPMRTPLFVLCFIGVDKTHFRLLVEAGSLPDVTSATKPLQFDRLSRTRGGESKKPSKKKKKTQRKSEKERIEKALKETDPAEAMGNSIRERADELRQLSPLLESIDQSVASLGRALGASDQRIVNEQTMEDSGGVEAAFASVLVHYFMKSHGGAHALQSLCSLLSTVAGLGAIVLAQKGPSQLGLTLTKRSCLFAMVKHVSGLLAASLVTARAIPEVGLGKARIWMQELAADPVSQYLFYAACVLLWLPTQPGTAWWQAYPITTLLLVGPIILREFISTSLVISDVLVLWSTSSTSEGVSLIQTLLKVGNAVSTAWMSLLVTPSVWSKADAPTRQAILAKITSRTSLVIEVAVGLLMAVDALWAAIEFFFANQSRRPPFLQLLRRLLCAQLYVRFLYVRRQRIRKLAVKMRGGAAQLPFYVLDVLMDPLTSMGLEWKQGSERAAPTGALGWRDYLRILVEPGDK